MTAPNDVLTRRQLNRALLGRQMLLEHRRVAVAGVLERLVGMQAQTPLSPYLALWSRIETFDPQELASMLTDRCAVRIGLMRGTIHLVTARDALSLRPVMQAVHDRAWRSSGFRRDLEGVDIAGLLAKSRELLEDRPLSAAELGGLLVPTWPDRPAGSLAYASRFLLPLVQVPPRAVWGSAGPSRHTTAEAWLGQPLSGDSSADATILRYLAAFGPATVADVRTWSWLTGVREVIDRLRPRLRLFRDEHGRELLDVPDGLLPDPDSPAPPRFLPDYDNIFLSHDDRSRIHGDVSFPWRIPSLGAVLIDGFVNATWQIESKRGVATLRIETGSALTAADEAAVSDEGGRLLALLAPDARSTDIQFIVRP